MRKNLRVRLGDLVTVTSCGDVPYGKRVHILPLDDTIEVGRSSNLYYPLNFLMLDAILQNAGKI